MTAQDTEPSSRDGMRPWAVAIIVFLTAVTIAAAVVWRLELQRRHEHQSRTANFAAVYAADLQRRLDQSLSATYALAALVRQGKGEVAEFDAVATQMLKLYPGVSALQLAPGGVIRKVVPLAGNEGAIGHDVFKDPGREKEARLARDTGQLTLAGPFGLKQGGIGAVARLPVYPDDEDGTPAFWGFATALIRFPKIIDASLLMRLRSQGFEFELWRVHPDTGQRHVIAGSLSRPLKEAVGQPVHVPNGTWTLSLVPLAGWGSPLQLSIWAGIGLLFSLLAAWLAKLVVLTRAHEAQMKVLVDRRTAEARESEARLGSLEDNLPDSYVFQYSVDEKKTPKFLHVSAGVERVHGVRRQDVLRDAGTLRHLVDPEQLPVLEEAEAASLRNMTDFQMEARVRRADGHWGWLQLRSRPCRRPDGQLVWDGVATDITKRKEADVASRHERDFSDALLACLPGIFCLFNDRAVLLRWNRNLETVSGYTAEEIRTMGPLDFFAGGDRQFVGQNMKKVFEEGAGELEINFVAKDGTSTPYFLSGIRARIENQVCLIGVGFDISERKRLEEQLLQSQKMEAIGQLSGGIAHDFNNMLQVIMGHCNLSMMDPAISTAQKETLGEIMASAEKASQLTHGLLAFSRKQVMHLRTANLNDVVHHVQKFLTRTIGEDVRLKVILNEAELPVYVDSAKIEQVLINLATNARDAMPKGGVLTVETRARVMETPFKHSHGSGEPGPYALIVVSDTGIGMDEATCAKIFEPFFTTKEVGKGTGLGMAIVYGIINQHNGYIEVQSEPGRGSTFKIYLPAVKAEHGTREEKPHEPPPRKGTETILVAEDDASVRRLTVAALKKSGYKVIEAEDGQEAVAKFAANREKIHLILMDLIMPAKNGKDAYEGIRKLSPATKVLYTSGYASDYIRSRGVIENGIELLMKPYRPADLLNKIRESLESRG